MTSQLFLSKYLVVFTQKNQNKTKSRSPKFFLLVVSKNKFWLSVVTVGFSQINTEGRGYFQWNLDQKEKKAIWSVISE